MRIENTLATVTSMIPRMSDSSDATRSIRQQAERLRDGLYALQQLHSAPDPYQTEAVHFTKTSESAARLADATLVANTRIQKTARDAFEGIDSRITQKANLTPNGFAFELRSAFNARDPQGKLAMMGEFVEAKNGALLAALVDVPSVLVGIEPDVQVQFRELLIQAVAPEELTERDNVLASLETGLDICGIVKAAANEFNDPARLAELVTQQKLSQAAANKFAASVVSD